MWRKTNAARRTKTWSGLRSGILQISINVQVMFKKIINDKETKTKKNSNSSDGNLIIIKWPNEYT